VQSSSRKQNLMLNPPLNRWKMYSRSGNDICLISTKSANTIAE
jgi:hypothetical protein